MTIVDNKYGAEIITKKGKVYKFDSAECMIRYMKTNNISEGFLNDLLVVDHTSKGMLTDAASAYYLLSDSLHSPMGAGLTAFSKKEDMQFFKKQYNGENYVWEKVVEKINAE
jgi:copper chaperone NosL